MAEKVAFELVSPEKLLVSEEVDMVVVPGEEGDLGVLPGHSPVIATLRPGTINIFEGNTVRTRIFVAGGFLEVTAERCTVLAEEAVNVSDLDRAAAEKGVSDAQDDIKLARDDHERGLAETALKVAEARLAAVASPVY